MHKVVNMAAIRLYNFTMTMSCFVGVGLSIYAYMVEVNARENAAYKALCDISEHMSCTKVFASPYAKGFGIAGVLLGEKSALNIPNSLFGIIGYSFLTTLVQSNSKFITKLSFLLVLMSNLLSLYFAYILYFILYEFCVVCVATYVVNFVNMTFTLLKLQEISKADKVDGRKKRK